MCASEFGMFGMFPFSHFSLLKNYHTRKHFNILCVFVCEWSSGRQWISDIFFSIILHRNAVEKWLIHCLPGPNDLENRIIEFCSKRLSSGKKFRETADVVEKCCKNFSNPNVNEQ